MKLDRRQQQITIDGHIYTLSQLHQHVAKVEGEQECNFLKELYGFLVQWFADDDFLDVFTSGSTGIPKVMKVSKDRMTQSAKLTCEYLRLKEGDTALLCLPLRYIAGKMMVVRALVLGLDLVIVTPSSNPLKNLPFKSIDFAAMVPMQVYSSLQTPSEKARLKSIQNLLIGGGAIDAAIEKELNSFPGAIYSTYGMTETLSHIALRRVNGVNASSHYYPFSSIRLSLTSENTLVIDAPLICEFVLETNDVVQLYDDGSFIVLGRKDNIINSGGIKMQIEEIENLLSPYIHSPYAITYINDSRLGQAVTLLIEENEDIEKFIHILPNYKRPKYVMKEVQIPKTETGKIDRFNCHLLAEKIILNKLKER